MKFLIYKITNKINNKIYIGIHQTDNVNDNYMGSGKLIKAAIKKYGKSSFNKDIIFIFDTLDQAIEKEKEIICEDFIAREDTYNIALGGSLGGSKINGLSFLGKNHSAVTKDKISKSLLGMRHISDEGIKKIIHNNKTNEIRKEKIQKALKGKKKTEDHKKKISDSLLKRNFSSIPRNYKRKYKQIWITDGIKNTRIPENSAIPEGWAQGRIIFRE
jgi:hypothetical protein